MRDRNWMEHINLWCTVMILISAVEKTTEALLDISKEVGLQTSVE